MEVQLCCPPSQPLPCQLGEREPVGREARNQQTPNVPVPPSIGTGVLLASSSL